MNAALVMGQPNLSAINGKPVNNGNTYQAAFAAPVTQFNIDSTKEAGKDRYLRVYVQFDKQAAQSGGKVNITLVVPQSSGQTKMIGKDFNGSTPSVNGKQGAYSSISGELKLPENLTAGNYSCSNLNYIYNGISHPVTAIKVVTAGTAALEAGGKQIEIGADPTASDKPE